MSTHTTTLADYRRKTGTNRLGLWLFIVSDAFMFAGLFISRFFLLGTAVRPELSQILGLVITVVLLTSSFFMNRAETAMSFGDHKGFLRGTLITFVLGVIFLIGVVGVEWQIAPFGPADGVAASLFYAMTGFRLPC
jgi:cytochrome c oxidase subunit 3